ncbi:sugar-binding transcriptional regulator [Protaetiibacter sp. SSC-01]|uniref:sugar-binding transcriptional regulator n=1 Tax=Protaetiibacter sp. SSC-01 TaxID=2759943 RepID=UPI001656F210|nr:sugar-binding domain-containing protein [Protaetiibacter sp. SSC-01]QNO36828.1 sugar-binding transcriptional regulator [Protaetiibacter sp. SSC-01]
MTSESPTDPKLMSALKAAQLYYLQDLTMDAIASELRTSRSSVSRLLAHARDTGLVEITITSPLDRGAQLEREIAARFRISAHVVPVPGSLSDVDRLDRVAMTAARLLPQYIESNSIVGIAWGSTLGALSRHLTAKETHDTVIVQMNGAGNTETTGIEYASEILERFGRAYSARIQQFPVPAFFDSPDTKEALWRERSTRRVLDLIARMDVAVFGLGSPFAEVPSRVYIGGYLGRTDYKSLAADRAVGDVATVFYRADGSWRDIALNARATGPGFDRLVKVARRICIVSGAQKLPSLRGALAAGLITDLVLDEGLARRLLESVS